ncbi:MAG: DNA polymerase III subunit gamma/tau, partial [Coriobacteriia bacterium]
MAHQSWYRTYRPQTFDDVVGQAHIERTLRNAVDEDSVAHAYLFTGPRGTGKTTTARILAKALNCEKGPSGQPDDTCEDCIAIAEGRHPDVYELDAASRTGVDAVREEIIGRVNYAPTRGRWKVYIIDEVHMLSNAAFNALLKTLEEPPPHTVFILCTTHPHKVPETIHSRCQRFDFHRLSVDEIAHRLRYIAEKENVTVADGALSLIARHALGGMRDAITTLEQLAAFSGGSITLEDVEGLLGEVDADVLFDAADIILERDVAGAFRFIAELAEQGVDMTEFVKAFVRHARDLFVVAAVPEAGEAVDVTSGDRTRLEGQARSFGLGRLARMLDVLDRLSTELRYAADQRLAVEVALTRMARPESELTLEALAERIESLEAGQTINAPAAQVAARRSERKP